MQNNNKYQRDINYFSLSDVIDVNEMQFVVVQSINVRFFDVSFIRFVSSNNGFARAEQRIGNKEIETETKSEEDRKTCRGAKTQV